jgi:hypothetical protein
MRIEKSDIQMQSNHTLEKSHTRTEFFTILDQQMMGRTQNLQKTKIQRLIDDIIGKQFDLQPGQVDELQKRQLNVNSFTVCYNIRQLDPLRELIEKLLHLLNQLGLELNRQDYPGGFQVSIQEPANLALDLTQFEFERRDVFRETETLRFGATGTVETADHRKIDFNTVFNLARDHRTEHSVKLSGDNINEIRPIDPLVINFQDEPAELSDTKFSFDLNADGKCEEIAYLGKGSGFLALDRNENGRIDDGAELFGPTTANGFTELSIYDEDHNGWIDEGDPVFGKLRIWEKDANGKDNLETLGQKGIGAICLQNTVAEFGYKNTADELLGQNRRAGVFLREDGTAGTVQQIDLVG